MENLGLRPEVQTPDQVHEALRIVYKRDWIPPLIMIGCVLWTVAFLLLGRIPVTGKGHAMFITRETVVPFQSSGSGQIAEWYVGVGDEVKDGQLLAVLEQPETEKQLEQAHQQLADLEEKNTVIRSLSEKFSELERQSIERKRGLLAERIATVRGEIDRNKSLTRANREENLQAVAKQEANLKALQGLEVQRLGELNDKLERTEGLRKDGLKSEDELLQARQAVSAQEARVDDMGLQVLQMQLTRVRADESFLNAINRITEREDTVTDLVEELEELDSRLTSIEKADAEAEYARQLEVSDLKRTIARLKQQLAENREIRAEFDGRVLELIAGVGKIVNRGARLGTIDTRDESHQIEAVAYFKLKDGKRLTPGMTLRLTPATVQRERFGSLITRIKSVSSFPVTPEGVANVVGNSTVAASLTKDNHQIEVIAELVRDETSATGYKWDHSSGPSTEITAGTLAAAMANIEERPPITFIVPILKSWQGFEFTKNWEGIPW